MNKIVQKWYSLGIIDDIPEDKIEFITNTLEILLAYLKHIDDDEFDNNSNYCNYFSIIIKIGNMIEFGINDLLKIIDEVRIGSENVDHTKTFNAMDAHSDFCEEYSKNKIIELQNKNK